jgi:trimethylamine--corrinoid protein Co-methyltransferase
MSEINSYTSEKELALIHSTSLRILSELGIVVNHQGMRERLVELGCRLKGERVTIPEALVAKVVKEIPPTFRLYGRDRQNSVSVEARGHTLYTNSGIVPNIYDFESGVVRHTVRRDLELTTRMMDELPNIDLIYVSLMDATEMSSHMVTVTDMAVILENTTKPLVGPGVTNRPEAEAIVALAQAIRVNDPRELVEYPICAPFICPITPLKYPSDIIEALIVIAESGLPLLVITNPVMGVTAPFTIAGTIALGHAEILASAVMAHAIHPCLPILSHNTPSIADMKTLLNTTGGPEVGLMRRTIIELSRSLGIPSWAPGHTSSAHLDIQAADEKSINALLIASAHPSILGGLGGLANITLTSYESLVLDNERFGAIRRILEGVAVDEDHLAFNVIANQIAGVDVIANPHTRKYSRSRETWKPNLAHRGGLVSGFPETDTVLDRARREARRIMDEHQVSPLPAPIKTRISEILEEYNSRVMSQN